jgi:hypothetical protein
MKRRNINVSVLYLYYWFPCQQQMSECMLRAYVAEIGKSGDYSCLIYFLQFSYNDHRWVMDASPVLYSGVT